MSSNERNEQTWFDEMGLDPEEYEVVCWPDSQMLMEDNEESRAAMAEATLVNDTLGSKLFGSSAYVLPKDVWEDMNAPEDAVTISLIEEDLPGGIGDELVDAIAEGISNKTGFCTTGFSFKIVVTTTLDKEGE